ncbi:MAG: TIM-barrel domain-containing protein [Chloroflexota bacterium]
MSFVIPAFDPLPDPAAVVTVAQARFTILTSRLLRLEFSPSGVFEDHPSQAFWYRRLPAPAYTLRKVDGKIEIETEHLLLVYQPPAAGPAAGFRPGDLKILVKATGVAWFPGLTPRQGDNLFGTARTLDEAAGVIRLEPGLVARQGWALVDDSRSLVFNAQGWLEPRSRPANQDWYFFGFGHDYPACLADFAQVAGQTPLIPRWALGNWWSRYWAYSADELLDLMNEFRTRQIPLSVCIVDMDWHLTETGNLSSGWTGYTWNPELFADPPAFLAALHSLGLKTALNLHPAEGIHPHEAAYPALARRLGIDPASEQPAPFDAADPVFMQAYFELLHHPLEAQGVDFWWLDWQQGSGSSLPGLDPLWWLNHLHFYDLGRDGVRRPFIFSRWGGLGNHRYPIGFSGDSVVGWEALDFQPAFTAAASNVGYGWWSHDIGGHMGGIEDDELYIRWLQYGVFSPIFRLHSTNVAYHERRPWRRGAQAERTGSAAMRLRHRLIPYLYSMAWRNHAQARPLISPMYYSHPEAEEAYACPRQYWFGSQLVAAPFTRPIEPAVGLSRQVVWLPDGLWFNFFTGEVQSAGWSTQYGSLDEIPVFAPAGAIVPLAPAVDWGGVDNPPVLHLYAFPGASGRFELYEDDGETTAYLERRGALTPFSQDWQDETLVFTIHPVLFDAAQAPAERTYHLHLRGVLPPGSIAVERSGEHLELQAGYDPETDTLSLEGVTLRPVDTLVVRLTPFPGVGLVSRRDRTLQHLRQRLNAFRLDTWVKARIEAQWPRIAAGQADLRSIPALNEAQTAALQALLRSRPAEY